jgi:hypothetical protein
MRWTNRWREKVKKFGVWGVAREEGGLKAQEYEMRR